MRTALLATVLVAGMLAPASVLAEDPALESDSEKTLYALGLALSRNLSSFEFTAEELRIVQVGIRDGVLGAEEKVSLEAYKEKLQNFMMARVEELKFREKRDGLAFCEQEAAKEGAVRTESGLVYFELTAGTGESPAASDTVRVHYHGTLRDGSVFDSSVERDEPVNFPLTGVIPCFSEGIQLMKVGGKSRLVCPSDIAYGDRGSAPAIAPGATLIFEIELLEIVTTGTETGQPGSPG
jgi:FKBP-type peptidyl-prolyl cis-trans isomerase